MAKGNHQHKPTCIFCGLQGTMSKQHIIKSELQKFFPDSNEHELRTDGSITAIRQGNLFTRRAGGVCRSCNQGWIEKVIEAEAMPAVKAMLQGESVIMSSETQSSVAAWIFLVSTMFEYTNNPAGPSISQEERFEFCKTHKPPSSWQIVIGRSLEFGQLYSYGSRHALPGREASQEKDRIRDVQVSIGVIGQLVFLASSSMKYGVGLSIDLENRGEFLFIQPASIGAIQWPPPSAMNIERLGYMLKQLQSLFPTIN